MTALRSIHGAIMSDAPPQNARNDLQLGLGFCTTINKIPSAVINSPVNLIAKQNPAASPAATKYPARFSSPQISNKYNVTMTKNTPAASLYVHVPLTPTTGAQK